MADQQGGEKLGGAEGVDDGSGRMMKRKAEVMAPDYFKPNAAQERQQ